MEKDKNEIRLLMMRFIKLFLERVTYDSNTNDYERWNE